MLRIHIILLSWLFMVSPLYGASDISVQKRWNLIPGKARTLAIASDGIVAITRHNGELWTWNNTDFMWTPLNGRWERVATLGGGRYYGIQGDGQLVYFDKLTTKWAGLIALDVAVGVGGNVYAIRADGALVHQSPQKMEWDVLDAVDGRKIVLAPDNSIWIIKADAAIAHWVNGKLRLIPGKAIDIAVGQGGIVIAVGIDGRLHRWMPDSNSWTTESGPPNLVKIALNPNSEPWVINTDGDIFTLAAVTQPAVRFDIGSADTNGIVFHKHKRNSQREVRRARQTAYSGVTQASKATDAFPITWIDTQASAASLAIASEGSVFSLNATGSIGRWSNLQKQFNSYPGKFLKIAVEASGNLWGINLYGRIFRHEGSGWVQVNGTASDIAIGVGGQIYANTAAGGLLKYDAASGSMLPIAGYLFSVAVAPDGVPWGLGKNNFVTRCPSSGCQYFDRPAQSLSIGPDGSVFIVTPGGLLEKLQANQTTWNIIPVLDQKVQSVAVGPNGRPWVIAASGRVLASNYFTRDESADQLEASTTSTQTTGSGSIAVVNTSVATSGFTFSKHMQFQAISALPGTEGGISVGPEGTVLMFLDLLARYDSKLKMFVRVTGFPVGFIMHAKSGLDGKLWILSGNVDGRIYHQLTALTYETIQLPIKNPQSPFAGTMNKRIDIAPDGTVYAIDTAGTIYHRPAGSSIFAKLINGIYNNIAVSRSGDVWVIDSNSVVRQIVNGVAERRPLNRSVLASDITAGQDGSVYITTNAGANNFPAKWNGVSQAWDSLNVGASFVAVEPTGRLWIYDFANFSQVLRAK